MTTSHAYYGLGKVKVGNESSIPISRVDSIVVSTNYLSLLLKVMLYVPNIVKNLMYVSQITKDNNVYFVFHSFGCLVKDMVTHQVSLEENECEGLY